LSSPAGKKQHVRGKQGETARHALLGYAKELWTIGNVIAGFSVLQALVVMEEGGKHCSTLGISLARENGAIGGSVFAVAVLAGYIVLIWACYNGQRSILRRFDASLPIIDLTRKAAWARSWVVTATVVLTLGFIWGQVFDGKGDPRYIAACGIHSTSDERPGG
jgi:hypothetical protein